MRILFTGASSFTGYWFVKELVAQGHEVVMTQRRGADAYKGVRRTRVDLLAGMGRVVEGCCFGDDRFMQVINEEGSWDLLCHHAAEVRDYKSPDFNIASALDANTHNLRAVLQAMRSKGCSRVLLTGSVFEAGEGAGSEGLPSFSPYGVSKAITGQVVAYHAASMDMALGKFVIPNPFGPYEEPRFTAYLVRSWYEGKTPSVNTPAYVRDNIHVSLLAKEYADFAAQMSETRGFVKRSPSGYVESQGQFALRFAEAMRGRLGLSCDLDLKTQTEFSEPRIRLNTDPADVTRADWSETRAWDAVADYYRHTFGPCGDMA